MIPILFHISVLLDVQANLPETSTFFQIFIALGMYNFELTAKKKVFFFGAQINRTINSAQKYAIVIISRILSTVLKAA